MYNNRTIVALATPEGTGALAIIRITGNSAIEKTEKIVKEKEKFKKLREREVALFSLKSGEKIIDEVSIIKYKSPKTFTGEDLVEIIAHGGKYTVKNIINELLEKDVKIAERGEFSKRAFLNGKINLIKAEAIKNIIESNSEKEYENSIESYKKEGNFLKKWKEKIEEEITYLEAEIEFGEEEGIKERDRKEVERLVKEIQCEIKRSETIRKKEKSEKIIITGPSNAGKSSLFNYLVGINRAIVNKKRGTTRDAISEIIEIKTKEVEIIDTAGIRKTKCEIEEEGIKKTKELLNASSLILWITDSSEKVEEEEKKQIEGIKKKNVILLLNKIDRKKNNEKEAFYKKIPKKSIEISVKRKKNLNKVIEEIEKRLKNKGNDKYLFINERQIQIAKNCENSIKKALEQWEQREIASHYLNEALKHFEEFFGKGENEKVINDIFDKFCIGK